MLNNKNSGRFSLRSWNDTLDIHTIKLNINLLFKLLKLGASKR